jgi:hypothetical protein
MPSGYFSTTALQAWRTERDMQDAQLNIRRPRFFSTEECVWEKPLNGIYCLMEAFEVAST